MRFRWLRAFTLIEMLVVLAIIGILAGILLPALAMARARVRITQASNDIAQLRTSIQQYVQDYGAYPPDGMRPGPTPHPSLERDGTFGDGTDNSGVPWPTLLSPNECLVWFLTRTYSKDYSSPGCPWNSTPWFHSTAIVVYSRVPGGPYASWSQKQLQNFNRNDFKEFVDPWGRPYMYRAYPRKHPLLKCDTIIPVPSDHTKNLARFYTNDPFYDLQDLPSNVGRVRITGNTLWNGTFDIGSAASNWFEVPAPNAAGSGVGGTVEFLLHNPEECDLYSLGPNGITRSAKRPTPIRDNGMGSEWKPSDGTQFDNWMLVWGSPGDGNDINSQTGNPGITSDKDKDDINNWK